MSWMAHGLAVWPVTGKKGRGADRCEFETNTEYVQSMYRGPLEFTGAWADMASSE
jgi:hypothetical protein